MNSKSTGSGDDVELNLNSPACSDYKLYTNIEDVKDNYWIISDTDTAVKHTNPLPPVNSPYQNLHTQFNWPGLEPLPQVVAHTVGDPDSNIVGWSLAYPDRTCLRRLYPICVNKLRDLFKSLKKENKRLKKERVEMMVQMSRLKVDAILREPDNIGSSVTRDREKRYRNISVTIDDDVFNGSDYPTLVRLIMTSLTTEIARHGEIEKAKAQAASLIVNEFLSGKGSVLTNFLGEKVDPMIDEKSKDPFVYKQSTVIPKTTSVKWNPPKGYPAPRSTEDQSKYDRFIEMMNQVFKKK